MTTLPDRQTSVPLSCTKTHIFFTNNPSA